MFISPFQTSPYPAHSSRDQYNAEHSRSQPSLGLESPKAAFMSPKHKATKRSPNQAARIPAPASLSLSAQMTDSPIAPVTPSAVGRTSIIRGASYLEQRRTDIRHWDQAKVKVERRAKRHPNNPYGMLVASFPYARESLVPRLPTDERDQQQQHRSNNGRLPSTLITRPANFYMQSTRRTAESGAPPSQFHALERRRILNLTEQLNKQTREIQAHLRRRRQPIEEELELSLENLRMTDVEVTVENVHEQSLAVQNEFISLSIDQRIRIEKFAPMWLCERLMKELYEEAKEELVKETVADAKRVCDLPRSELDKSTALMQSPLKAVIADKFNIELLGGDLVKLRNLDWLSDQTINFYMEMLGERQKRNQSSPHVLAAQKSRIHYFNTFFYNKLSPDAVSYKYKDVSRWMKRAKIDITQLDKVILPVHVSGNHWCLAIINLAARRFEYYDSLGGRNPQCLKNLRQYVKDEVQANAPGKLEALQLDSWPEVTMTNIPRQNNGSVSLRCCCVIAGSLHPACAHGLFSVAFLSFSSGLRCLHDQVCRLRQRGSSLRVLTQGHAVLSSKDRAGDPVPEGDLKAPWLSSDELYAYNEANVRALSVTSSCCSASIARACTYVYVSKIDRETSENLENSTEFCLISEHFISMRRCLTDP
jgi:hypothetical protein